jgi:hypothetical protein
MNQNDRRRYVPYSEARREIRNADLLLWRPTSLHGWLVSRLTRSEHCHASKASWVAISPDRSVLAAIETAERTGGTSGPLSEQVERYAGAIDVYEANPDDRWPEYDRAASIEWSWRNIPGKPYGLWALVRAGLTLLPWVRLLVQPSRDDMANGTKAPHCSAACSMADRIGGHVDPVPGRSDLATEPGDLERSSFYRYRFTLVPDDWKEA